MMRLCALLVLATLMFAQATSAGAQVLPQKPPAQAAPQKPAAQAPPPTTPAQSPQAAPKPQAPAPSHVAATPVATRASITLMMTDLSGLAVPDVHVAVTGPVSREGTTARDGGLTLQSLKAGNYRLRFESAGFITLERDVVVKAGPPTEVDVALDRAPAMTAEPPPTPTPMPAAARASAPAPSDSTATVDVLSLPNWIEKNLILRNDPQKETIVGRTPATTATVVQIRDPIKDRVRADADEMLYVIAGEGVLRAKGREQALDAGALAVVPRGVVYTLERRGRNPLFVLSVVGR